MISKGYSRLNMASKHDSNLANSPSHSSSEHTNTNHAEHYDLVVIGSGPAGEKGASQAAYLGRSVLVIDASLAGGAWVNTGTIPSKTLRETALYLSGGRGLGISTPFGRERSVRNLMAMDTEEMIKAQPMDGVVLIGGCDKTVPAQLMAAASADIPAISVVTGPMLSGSHRGERIGACTDCRRFWADYRSGAIDRKAIDEITDNLVPSYGTCGVMGTASTMACITEALGMMLPGGATKAWRICRPWGVRIGIFCKFGFEEDNLPVAATAW